VSQKPTSDQKAAALASVRKLMPGLSDGAQRDRADLAALAMAEGYPLRPDAGRR
jgi:hypothetical protein